METGPPTGADAVSVEQFARCLTESGLAAADEAKAIASRVPAHQRSDCRPLAQMLVKQGKLTPYQAGQLVQGKSKGLILDNYVILDKIGQGGMGMVFKARHRKMDRVVALKVLAPALVKDATKVQRFQREVRAASHLNHPHIVAALDAGQDRGVHFLVMELVDGIDLSRKVRQSGPLPVALAVRCVAQAARGLAHAHAAGIIHRDIKPGNLLLASPKPGRLAAGTGTVKILDMGLARFEDGGNAPGSTDELTKSGSVLGTSDYMAPEQAVNSKHADARADIYSLGCTLFFLLTGQPMYGGETMMEKLLAHRDQPIPDLGKLRPEVPSAVQSVFQRMVAKKPEDRYPSMAEVLADLERCLDSRSGEAAAVGRRPARPLLLAGSAAVILLAGAIIAAVVLGSSAANSGAAASGSSRETTSSAATSKPVESIPSTIKAADTTKSTSGPDDDWLKQLAGLTGKAQLAAFIDRMKQVNPAFRGRCEPRYDKGGSLYFVEFETDYVSDLWPVRGLNHLQDLRCTGSDVNRGKLNDLSPLTGMQLRILHCGRNPQVSDLGPLKGIPLRRLWINQTAVSDLGPLRGMPLEILDLTGSRVRDLAPLQGMPLTSISLRRTSVNDFSPLKGMPLVEVHADIQTQAQADVLRSLPTLKQINDSGAAAILRKWSK
jgi:serine/threonine protein kinase